MRSRLLPILLLVLACLVSSAHATSPRFIEPQEFPLGGYGYDVVLADFNGDSKTDMAVTVNNASSVAILLSTGTGFRAPVNYAAGKSPSGIAVADFNRDGKLDLAIANSDVASSALSILLGNGDGTFQPAITQAAAPGSLHLAVADFNQDGNPDVAISTSSYGQDAVTVLLGRGDGTFIPGPTLAHESEGLAADDVNGDGKPDILTNFGKTLHVYLGTGDGTFQKRLSYSTAGIIHGIALGDFNADGKLDVATTAHYTGTASILLGNGDGTFQKFVAYGVGNFPAPIVVDDLDGDGHLDLVVGNEGGCSVSILFGKGDGTFLNQVIYGTTGVQGLAAADVNGDGKPDLITVAYGFNNASVLINSGSRQFRGRPESFVGTYPIAAVTGDFDNTGKDDVAVASELGTYSTTITSFLNQGGGVLQRHTTRVTLDPSTLLVGDFNADGRQDLLDVLLYAGTAYEFLPGNGDGTFQDTGSHSLDYAYEAGAADLNKDGVSDLVLINAPVVEVLLGTGDGTFGTPTSYNMGSALGSLTIADFDGDGNLDLAFSGAGDVSVLRGNGDGTFQHFLPSLAHQYFTTLRAGDLNGDAHPDLVGVGDGVVGVLLGKGDGSFQPEVDYPIASADNLAVGDFNMDGTLDLAVARIYDLGIVTLLLNNGDGTFVTGEDYFVGYRGGSYYNTDLAVGDFNSDGVPDLARTEDHNYASTLNFLLSTK